jgi:hypothetical protein
VQWYLDNPVWIEGVVSGSYREWLQKQYNWIHNYKISNSTTNSKST